MNSIRAVGAKALTTLVSLLCGVTTTRLVIGDVGVEYFALFSMLITLPSLLSFTDLGSGAVIVNGVATSDDVRHDRKLVFQLTTVGRILITFATVLMAINAILLGTGGWRAVLGNVGSVPGADMAAFLCLTIFAMGIPIGIWVRIMLGLQRNHLVILLQGLVSPLTLLGVWVMLQVDQEQLRSYLGLSSYFAVFAVSAVGLALTAYSTRPLVPRAASRVLRRKQYPGVQVMDVGWPMLAQLLAFPIAVSTQRYILAQWGTHHDVAEYGVAGQVFFALNGLVVAAGLALWPMYAKRRHHGELSTGPYGLSALFAVSVVAVTAVVALGNSWIFGFITDGSLEVGTGTIVAFGLMVTCNAALYPLGMFIMDKPGIRFQVIPTLTMAVVSAGLSVVLADFMGAAGPPLGNAVAVIVCQIIPFALYIRRHQDRLLARVPDADRPNLPAATADSSR